MDKMAQEQWLAHPGTGRLLDRLLARLRETEANLLSLSGPDSSAEMRLQYYGARVELLQIIEEHWGQGALP